MVDEAEYRRTLAEMIHLAQEEPDRASPAGRRLSELAALAEAYEEERPGPVEDDADRR